MNKLSDFLPDRNELAELSPARVGVCLLSYLNAQQDQREVNLRPGRPQRHPPLHLGNLASEFADELKEVVPSTATGALMEGLSWLVTQGFLVPAPSQDVGWLTLSRAARAVREADQVDRVLRSRALRKGDLHPAIAQKCWASFLDGEFDTAVFRAFREVEISLRAASGLADEYGKDLVMAALRKGGPLWDGEARDSENDGWKFLFAGATLVFKNATSHREVHFDDPVEAAEVIGFASLLLRMLDRRVSSLERG